MSAWDKLWEEPDARHANWIDKSGWIKRVRTEGDIFKGDAERWRKLHREDPDATIDIYEEFDGAIEELNWLRDQFEEIEKWFKKNEWFIDEEHTKSPAREVLRKILSEEFERSDDSLISKHIAIKTYAEREFKAGYLIKPSDLLKILEVS